MKKVYNLIFDRWTKAVAFFLFILLLTAYANISAIFTPGQTLDPNCAPGIAGCIVSSTQNLKTVNGNSLIGSGDITIGAGSSQWTTSGSDIYFTGGKVGVGTTTPTAALVTKGNIITTGPNLITNGTFDTDSAGWNLYDTGSYNSGKLTVNYTGVEDDAKVSTDITTESGKKYLLTFTLSDVEGDTVYFFTDNNSIYTNSNNYGYSNGTYSVIVTSDYTGSDTINFTNWYWDDPSTWSLDNVSMREVDVSSVVSALDVLDFNNKKILSLGGLDNGNFFAGADSGTGALYVTNSNFIGPNSGLESEYASNSNFLGAFAGYKATNSSESNFLGVESGYKATDAWESNFIGRQTGFNASNARYSNFIGVSSGYQAVNARGSNFLGYYAGDHASDSYYSNFIGNEAGGNATNAAFSNFIGSQAGRDATNANGSTFIGNNAGQVATNAAASAFIGGEAGYGATNAQNSVFIGSLAGYNDTVNNTTNENDWSILIGYRNNTGGFKNSILIGGASDGNAISNTKANQFMLAPSVTEMRLRGIDYTMPSDQASASGQVLTNDGSGVLSWAAAGGGSSPVSVVGSGLSSTAISAGSNSRSVFLGASAGESATNASDSVFLGMFTGYEAAEANHSNFIGSNAGFSATNASFSNFIGDAAGSYSTNASSSNFIGGAAGGQATDAYSSNFLGPNSGALASNAHNSNFIGELAGYSAVNASHSNFSGYKSGYQAASAANSNFLGNQSGYNSTYAFQSNFLGAFAGNSSEFGNNSNFLGYHAGDSATNANNSNFSGFYAGYLATNASNSNFFGSGAGDLSTNANNSNFIGSAAGQSATNANNSNFLGTYAGEYATGASNSIFIGQKAGYSDTVDNTSNGLSSILIGSFTNTGGFSNSILLGSGVSGTPIANTKANQFMLAPTITELSLGGIEYTLPSAQASVSGQVLTNDGSGGLIWTTVSGGSSPITIVNSSNLFSTELGAGSGVTTVINSNFFGSNAGYNATSAGSSNFFGFSSGYQATDASGSNFLGNSAGNSASSAYGSNFIGNSAGYQSTNAWESNFLGNSAGYSSVNASNSIFIGTDAGSYDTVNNTGNSNNFSILIGKATRTGGFSNSIAIGGSATNTASNQFMIGSTTRPINTTVWKGASATATLDTSTGLITTSDERLKTNIIDLPDDILNKLVNVRTVTFNWLNGDSDKTNIGFLAQDLQNYFPELVYENADQYLGVNYANMTPVLTEAIKELNLKVKGIGDLTKENDFRDSIIAWFADFNNGIKEFTAGTIRAQDKLCIGEGVDEICVTKDELLKMKGGLISSTQKGPPEESIIPHVKDPTPTPNPNPTPNPTPSIEGGATPAPPTEVPAVKDSPVQATAPLAPTPVVEAPVVSEAPANPEPVTPSQSPTEGSSI